MCEQVVCTQVVCGQVVCEQVRGGGGRRRRRAGGGRDAEPKTRTPHKDVGKNIQLPGQYFKLKPQLT